MHTENESDYYLTWKKVADRTFVSHFTSSCLSPGYGQSQIYVKKFESRNDNSQNEKVIFILHDLCQHHGRFIQLIEWLQNSDPNISVCCLDFVGHGLSSGTRGHYEKLEGLADDVIALLTQYKKKNFQTEQWILLGHGLGGIVALDLMSRYQHLTDSLIDKLIISNFTMQFTSSLLNIEKQLIEETSFLFPLTSHLRPLKIFKGNDLLSNSVEIMKLELDPLVVQRPTLKSIREIQKKMSSIYLDSYYLDRPILLLKSQNDPLIYESGIEYFARGLKKNILNEKKYSNMKHDLYNEVEREVVFNDILNWINL